MNYTTRNILVFGLCSLFLMLTGCRPKGILSSTEMRKVLVDLHKTDALLATYNLQFGHDDAENIYYAQVLEKHGTTQAQFDSSLVWYTAHPVFFDKIYPKVKADLKEEHDAFIAAHAAELNLTPGRSPESAETAERGPRTLTQTQLDSVLWVTQHGYPSHWTPVHVPFRMVP